MCKSYIGECKKTHLKNKIHEDMKPHNENMRGIATAVVASFELLN